MKLNLEASRQEVFIIVFNSNAVDASTAQVHIHHLIVPSLGNSWLEALYPISPLLQLPARPLVTSVAYGCSHMLPVM